ncbi:MAG: histidine phosphatase family protein [Pseudomonadales bacterium]
MALSLILVRHGQIEANRDGHWHGSTDSPLLAKGERQARRTGRYFARRRTPLSAIYTSPLARCQTTANLISTAINAERAALARRSRWSRTLHRLSWGALGEQSEAPDQHQLIPEVVDNLREYAIGEWEGLSFSELAKTHQFVDQAIADHDYAPPKGESLRQVSERMTRALQHVHERHGPEDRVLVVAHGAALAVALATLLNNDPGMWPDYHFDNCSISELALQGMPELHNFNLTGHL